VAATLNAAAALGRAERLGTLEPGKQADVVVLGAPSPKHLVYHFGVNLVRTWSRRGASRSATATASRAELRQQRTRVQSRDV